MYNLTDDADLPRMFRVLSDMMSSTGNVVKSMNKVCKMKFGFVTVRAARLVNVCAHFGASGITSAACTTHLLLLRTDRFGLVH